MSIGGRFDVIATGPTIPSYYLGIDACQNDGSKRFIPDSLNGNIGVGAAVYTLKVRTCIAKEV